MRKQNCKIFWSLAFLCYLEVRSPLKVVGAWAARAPCPRPSVPALKRVVHRAFRIFARFSWRLPAMADPRGGPRAARASRNMFVLPRSQDVMAVLCSQVLFWIFCLVSPAVASGTAVVGPDLNYLATEQASRWNFGVLVGFLSGFIISHVCFSIIFTWIHKV